MAEYFYFIFILGGISLLFASLGVILIVAGIRSKQHVAGKCGAVLVPANCIDTHEENYTGEIGPHDGATNYQRGTKRGVYEYSFEGVQYTEIAILATNFKKYVPKVGACTIAINRKNPRKIYAPAGNGAGNILLFIGISFFLVAFLSLLPLGLFFYYDCFSWMLIV